MILQQKPGAKLLAKSPEMKMAKIVGNENVSVGRTGAISPNCKHVPS